MPTTLPVKDEDVIALLRRIADGLREGGDSWPASPVDAGELLAMAGGFEAALADQLAKKAEAEAATQLKNELAANARALNSRMKRWAESIVGPGDPRLASLGFRLPSPPQPLAAPGPPEGVALIAAPDGTGYELRWKKPCAGGPPATYKVYTRSGAVSDEPATLRDAVPAAQMSVRLGTGVAEADGFVFVRALNNAGEGPPSAVVQVRG